MPVTELAWIPSATPGSIPPAFVEAGRKGMEAQSEWAAHHASATLPTGGPPSARGAALYQQREDRGLALVTAHWESAAQHAACIGSEENRRAMEAIVPLAVPGEIRFFHVEGVRMFSGETLEAGLLSVVRIGVEGEGEGKREGVEKVWDHARRELAALAGFEHMAGWRIEKELGREDSREEFVVVGAWRDEDALSRFAEGGGEGWKDVWKGVMLDMDVKSYIRMA
ncbi:hypothetical protein GGR51DRAFT_547706 [Nemania sp. FL0031]|nr:hypothetical protein GGR51DRAFT_547706 [Nemania sp. FL0031]